MLYDHTTKSRFPLDDRICHIHGLSFLKNTTLLLHSLSVMFRDGSGYMLYVTDCLHELICYNLLEEEVTGWLQEKQIMSYPVYPPGLAAVNIFATKQCQTTCNK